MPDEPHARLHLPGSSGRSGAFLAVERDTRGVDLAEADRFNYYPASPLPMISWIFEGRLHLVDDLGGDRPSTLGPVLDRVVFSGPHRRPTASWSPGPVHALSVTFAPDVLAASLGIRIEEHLDRTVPLAAVASGAVAEGLLALEPIADIGEFLRRVEAITATSRTTPHDGQFLPNVRTWTQALAVRAAFTRTGAGARQAQRRIRAWTGQSHRDLQLYARLEEAFAHLATRPPEQPVDLADLAADAGYADQSHLGRGPKGHGHLPGAARSADPVRGIVLDVPAAEVAPPQGVSRRVSGVEVRVP